MQNAPSYLILLSHYLYSSEKKSAPLAVSCPLSKLRSREHTAWSARPRLSATAVRCLRPHDTRRFSSGSRTISWSHSTARANAQPSTRQPAAGNHMTMQRGWPCAQQRACPWRAPCQVCRPIFNGISGYRQFQGQPVCGDLWAQLYSRCPAVVQSNAAVPVCASGIIGARLEVGNDPHFEPKNARALQLRDTQTQPSHCPIPVSVRCRLLRSHVLCERRSVAFVSGVCPHRHPLQGWRWGHLHGDSGGARRSPDLELGPNLPHPVRG
jgi:hypothetical protein